MTKSGNKYDKPAKPVINNSVSVKEETSTQLYIVSSNDLIRAKYSYTLWEKRVFLYMISRLRRDQKEFPMMRMYVRDLMRFFDTRSNDDYRVIRSIPESISKKPFYVPYQTKDGEKRWAFLNVISIGTQPDENEAGENAYIELKFNLELMPHLLELKEKFTRYNIRNITELQSVYSIRIFEFLKENEYKRDGFETSVEDLKDMLFMNAKDNEGRELYPLYADFKKRVLLKAQEDLAKFCDITFEFDERKIGKKVVSLYFRTRQNRPQSPPSVEATPKAKNGDGLALFNDLLPKIKELGISESVLRLLLETQSVDAVLKGLAYTEHERKKGVIKDSIDGYFITAVKQNFTSKAFEHDLKQKQQAPEKKVRKQQLENTEKELQYLRAEYTAAINAAVRDITSEDESATDRAIAAIKIDNADYLRLAQLDPSVLNVDDFRQNPMLRALVIETIRKQHSDRFESMDKAFLPKIQKVEKEIVALKG
jgi:plasmid replication initiation protein